VIAHESDRSPGLANRIAHRVATRICTSFPETHFGRPGEGPKLKSGMFFTVEPMVNAGRPEVKILDDGWTAVTRDRSLSAQFEHMVAVTDNGVEIFTLSPKGMHKPPYSG
jgi:methionyl aminopeptidase